MRRVISFRFSMILLAAGLACAIGILALFAMSFQSGAGIVDAVVNDDRELVAQLLEQGHKIDAFGKDSWTPLTMAVEKDNAGMVRYLLEMGADPNRIVPGGTAMDMAVRRQRNEIALILAEFGGECSETCN